MAVLTPLYMWRKRALEASLANEWDRIEKLEAEEADLSDQYESAMKSHCEASLCLMGTAQMFGRDTFQAHPYAYDNYVTKVHEFAYAQMSLVSKREAIAQAQDRYNELAMKLDDVLSEPWRVRAVVDEDNITDADCDELEAIEPPQPRRRRSKRLVRKRKV